MRAGGADPDGRLRDMALDGVVAEVIYPTFGLFIDMIPARRPADGVRAGLQRLARGDVPAPARRVHPVRDRAGPRRRRRRRPSSNASPRSASRPRRSRRPPPEGIAVQPAGASTRCGRSRPTRAIPLSLHTGTGALPQHERGPGGAVINYAKVGLLSAETLCYFAASGVLERFPDLRLVFVETGAGWLAYCCERMDEAFEEHEQWVNPSSSGRRPTYVRRAVLRHARRRPRAVAHPRDHRRRTAAVGERLPAPRRHVPGEPAGRRAHLRRRPRRRRCSAIVARQRRPPLPASVMHDVTPVNTLKDKTAVVGVGATPYYKRGRVAAADADGARGQGGARRARRRRPHRRRPRRLRALQHGLRHVAVRAVARRARRAVHRDAHRRRRRRGRVRSGSRPAAIVERHGRVRRVGDDAAAGGEPLRRVVRAARERGERDVQRAAVARGQLPPAVGADGARARCSRCSRSGTCTCTARRASTSARSRSRPAANAIRRPTSLMKEPLTREQYFAARMISDPLCLYDFCLECDGAVAVVTTTRRAGAGPPPPARVRDGVRARRARALGAGDHVDGHARRRVRVVGPPPGRAAALRDGRRRARRRRRRAALRPLHARW